MSEPEHPRDEQTGSEGTEGIRQPTVPEAKQSHNVDQAMRRNASAWPASQRRLPAMTLRPSDVLKGAIIVLAVYYGLQLLWNIYALAIAAFLGVLFGLADSTGVEPLATRGIPFGKRRLRLPRGLAAAVLVLGAVGTLAGVVLWSAPTLRREFAELRVKLPQAIEEVDNWLESREGGLLGPVIAGLRQGPVAPDTTLPIAQGDTSTALPTRSAGQVEPDSVLQQQGIVGPVVYRVVATGQRYLFPFIASAFTVIAGLVLILMLAVYVAADPGLYQRGLMHLVPHPRRERAGEVLSAIANILRRWLRAQLIGMVVIGLTTTIALYILGVPAALPLGILAGLLEFIPNVGPLLSAAPAVLMGFIDGPQKALWVAATYMVIQQLENHLLVPMLMQEGVDIPPVLTILAQALMAIVFGFLGLLIAVPLLAIVMVSVRMLYVEGIVGDTIDDEEPG